ncbi:hypothetical protein FSP39_005493 [Pinctada imbricata]|uniref:DDE Tnp4 domain-containing protein n=1 Tax=Pinctada imbricata TaxID=66713 RepID=A0AA89C339_PINIB|nr:hypothetical protein FSP39_005493 [Pinctada imbricata]
MGVDKSTVSRSLDRVTAALISKKDIFIKWPSFDEQSKIKESKFLNIEARWPGSTHAAHIFRASDLCLHLEMHHRQLQDGILLGDSGYPCRPFLLTPYLRPATTNQERYNGAHVKARCVIERAFGWLKRRFHCLHTEIRMTPDTICKIIGACAILHDIAITMRDTALKDDVAAVDQGFHDRLTGTYQDDGRAIRNRHVFLYKLTIIGHSIHGILIHVQYACNSYSSVIINKEEIMIKNFCHPDIYNIHVDKRYTVHSCNILIKHLNILMLTCFAQLYNMKIAKLFYVYSTAVSL